MMITMKKADMKSYNYHYVKDGLIIFTMAVIVLMFLIR